MMDFEFMGSNRWRERENLAEKNCEKSGKKINYVGLFIYACSLCMYVRLYACMCMAFLGVDISPHSYRDTGAMDTLYARPIGNFPPTLMSGQDSSPIHRI